MRRIWIAVLLFVTGLFPTGSWSAGVGPVHAEIAGTRQVRILVHSLADSGPGSLRQALLQANAAAEGATVSIEFDILACHGPCTIRPATALPPIRHDDVTIDGYSQLGAREATAETAAQLMIALDGRDVTNNGLSITGAGTVVKGLSIHGFAWNGIAIGGPEARGNLVIGNHIGLDPSGSTAPGNGFSGVYLALGAHQNGVGGPVPAQRNVIAGNGWEGVGIHGESTRENVVLGNYIGTDAAGEAARPNALDGVRVYGGAHDNRIGLLLAEVAPGSFGNLISGNGRDGVRIAGEGSDGNRLWANRVGTTQRSGTDLANGGNGVHVLDGARDAVIAGAMAAGATGEALCLISGNDGDGVRLDGAHESAVQGCRIGTIADGGWALANAGDGVHVVGAADVRVGGDGSGEGNLISGNLGSGVVLSGTATTGAVVAGNLVGLNGAGNGAAPNQGDGIVVAGGASRNRVGTEPVAPESLGWSEGRGGRTSDARFAPSGRNIVSANGGNGVRVTGDGTNDNVINGNKIGTDADGTWALGNGQAGVFVTGGARRTLVGAGGPEGGNLISANRVGVAIFGAGTAETLVSNNQIGVAAGGVEPMGNLQVGISIQDGAVDSRIGPGNIIAHNDGPGVWVHGAATRGHHIGRGPIHHNLAEGIRLADGANGGIQPPTAEAWQAASRTLLGRTCSGCTVEAFANADDDGEGETPLTRALAGGGGAFSLSLPALDDPWITLTATDDSAGTSRFSSPFRLASLVPSPTPTPTSSPTATARPAPSATPTRTATASPSATATPSASRTSAPSATPEPTPTLAATATTIPLPTVRASATPRPTASTGPTATTEPSATATVGPTPAARIHLPLALRAVTIDRGAAEMP